MYSFKNLSLKTYSSGHWEYRHQKDIKSPTLIKRRLVVFGQENSRVVNRTVKRKAMGFRTMRVYRSTGLCTETGGKPAPTQALWLSKRQDWEMVNNRDAVS